MVISISAYIHKQISVKSGTDKNNNKSVFYNANFKKQQVTMLKSA